MVAQKISVLFAKLFSFVTRPPVLIVLGIVAVFYFGLFGLGTILDTTYTKNVTIAGQSAIMYSSYEIGEFHKVAGSNKDKEAHLDGINDLQGDSLNILESYSLENSRTLPGGLDRPEIRSSVVTTNLDFDTSQNDVLEFYVKAGGNHACNSIPQKTFGAVYLVSGNQVVPVYGIPENLNDKTIHLKLFEENNVYVLQADDTKIDLPLADKNYNIGIQAYANGCQRKEVGTNSAHISLTNIKLTKKAGASPTASVIGGYPTTGNAIASTGNFFSNVWNSIRNFFAGIFA